MNESIGNSLLFKMVIMLLGIVALFFIGIISYAKAYRVKNRIIEIIEKNGTYDATVVSEINNSLGGTGYSIVNKSSRDYSKVLSHFKETGYFSSSATIDTARNSDKNTDSYNYCVYEVDNSGSKYYIVVTFVHFDVPVVGNWINIPVYGETKILGKSYDY